MRKWTGAFACGSLPAKIEADLRRRAQMALTSRGLPQKVNDVMVCGLIDEVSFAFVGRDHALKQSGPGRPISGPSNLLSVNVAALLKDHDVRGNWLGQGDSEEDGQIGIGAELEAIAQTAFRQACDASARGIMARPARISDAKRLLGKVTRNEPRMKGGPSAMSSLPEAEADVACTSAMRSEN